MRVLVVLTQPPSPEGGAPGRCAVALLRGLQAHGVDVRAIAARHHFALRGEPPDDLPVEVFGVAPEPRGWTTRLNRLRRPRGELGRGAFAERVQELAKDVDVVHLEETETAWADNGVATPSLVHIHYLVRKDRGLPRPWTRSGRDTLELMLAERSAIRRHRHLVASSPVVADGLRRASRRADVVLAPLALDPHYYAPAPLDGPPVVGMIGTAAGPPTAAAMRRLAQDVWPALRRRVPAARLLIAGRGTASLSDLEGAGVDVLGEVHSTSDFLHRLSLLLFPLERGSGVKVKVLEALASGLPVVTTAAGAEGVDGGAGIVVVREDDQLAAAAAALLVDDAERRERGTAGRSAFEARYSPLPATRPLVELYRRM